MSRCGIVPDCPNCDIEHDGAEDGRCCTVLFCDLHLAAGRLYRELRVETVTQARLARIYREDARTRKADGFPSAASDYARIAAVHRRTFKRLLEIVKLAKPKAAGVPA